MLRAVLINATDLQGHHGCTLVNRQIEALAEAADIKIVAHLPLHADWSKLVPQQLDCVIVNGEGTLHSDSKGAKRISVVPRWASNHRVPAFLINSIYQHNSNEVSSGVKQFNKIWVRDTYSQLALRNDGIDTDYVPDLTLSWTPPNKSRVKEQIVIQDSAIKEVRRDLYLLSQEMKARYLPLIAMPLQYPSSRNFYKRTKFVLIKKAGAFFLSDERSAAYANAVPDFFSFIEELWRSCFIITGRFHGIALALKLNIPFLAVKSNSHKMEALLESVGMQHRLVAHSDDIRDKVRCGELLEFSQTELDAIVELGVFATSRAKDMFFSIASSARKTNPSCEVCRV